MFTTIEGEWDEAMAVVKAAVDAVAAALRGQPGPQGRPSPGVTRRADSKVETVERYLADED